MATLPASRMAAWLLLAGLLCGPAGAAEGGVDIGRPSPLRNLVPAEQLERQSAQQYAGLKRQAAEQRALAPEGHPQLRRLRAIAARLIPYSKRFNARAGEWRWEVNLIGSRQINAFCMPGDKIAFFTGILDALKLTDDEVAIVMGHEIAHALREHARERIAKNGLTQLGANLLGQVTAGGQVRRCHRGGRFAAHTQVFPRRRIRGRCRGTGSGRTCRV